MNNSFQKIRSKYILKRILVHLEHKINLEIFRYNKKMQRKLDIRWEDYEVEFSKLNIELTPVQNTCGKFITYANINENSKRYIHSYFNDSRKEIRRNVITKGDKVNKIKIVIDYKIS